MYADAGYVLEEDPPTVRGPDVSYVSRERVLESGHVRGFWRLGPDLAVEVLSPSNIRQEILEKVREYFAAGSRLVWVVDPARRTVMVYDAPETVRILEGHATLCGGDVLPGLRVPRQRAFLP